MGIYDAEDFTEEVADGGDFLVLTFLKSKNEYPGITSGTPVRVKSREHWFFKVEASRRITLRPYNAGQAVAAFNQAQNGTTRAYLEPQEGIGPVALVDGNGEEILRNDDDEWFLYHVGVSPLQGDIRVYPQIPDSQPGGVFQYLGASRPAAQVGDNVGYVSGDDHPSFYDPEWGISTTLVWHQGIQTNVKYQFFNEHQTRRKIPLLNVFGAGYSITPILDDEIQQNLLESTSGGHPDVTHVEFGPIRETYSYNVPDEWDNAANYVEEVEPTIPDKFKNTPSTPDVGDAAQTANEMSPEELIKQATGDQPPSNANNKQALKELVRRARE